jgi:hypothetical protein
MSEPEGDTVNETRGYTCEAGVYRPRLRVILIPDYVSGVPVSCDALVDSGADWCCFPERFAKELDIDTSLLPQQEIAGVYGEPEMVNFGMVPIDLGFASYSEAAVLGQLGFFNRFFVVFDTANKRFAITNRKTPESEEQ